jgi:hypothetical protein
MLKLLYFDVDSHDLDDHALRYKRLRGILWGQTHIVLVMSIALLGSALSLAVGLERDIEDVHENVRRNTHWLLCGSCSAATLTVLVVRLCHNDPAEYRDP